MPIKSSPYFDMYSGELRFLREKEMLKDLEVLKEKSQMLNYILSSNLSYFYSNLVSLNFSLPPTYFINPLLIISPS